jgi:hypothetical protein
MMQILVWIIHLLANDLKEHRSDSHDLGTRMEEVSIFSRVKERMNIISNAPVCLGGSLAHIPSFRLSLRLQTVCRQRRSVHCRPVGGAGG